jgi:hypothetical protein
MADSRMPSPSPAEGAFPSGVAPERQGGPQGGLEGGPQGGQAQLSQGSQTGPGSPEELAQNASIHLPSSPEEEVEAKIRRIEEIIQTAKSMPLSSSVLVPKEEMLMLLADLRESLPKELRQARWILREKDDFIARARREAELIVEEAQAEAARIVSETEIMREAEWKAGILLGEAEERARTLKAETDGYIDAKLASFEALLRRMLETIVAGRERLRAVPPMSGESSLSESTPGDGAREGAVAGVGTVRDGPADFVAGGAGRSAEREPGLSAGRQAAVGGAYGGDASHAGARRSGSSFSEEGSEFFDQDQV